MTQKEAKEISLELWGYLAKHLECDRKYKAPSELYSKVSVLNNECPLCELFVDEGCCGCPLFEARAGCFSDNSVWDSWQYTSIADYDARKKAAEQIIEIVSAWEPQDFMTHGVKIITGLVSGTFKSERDFKRAVLSVWKDCRTRQTVFEIENEEKEPGMPDVLTMPHTDAAFFTEFKYADENGVVEFQKSQPLFYRRHPEVRIQILVWDSRMGGRVVCLDPSEVVKTKSLRMVLPEVVDEVVEYDPEGASA